MINICVCIKPIASKFLSKKSSLKYDINPYDLFALKCAVELKSVEEVHIVCICMGPVESESVLKKCIGYGADKGILISDSKFAGSDTYATTYILSLAIRKLGEFNLIFCGEKTLDGETGQVGIGLAARLEISLLTGVRRITQVSSEKIICETQNESILKLVGISSQSLLVFRERCDDVYLSFFQLRKMENAQVQVLDAKLLNANICDCGWSGSKTKINGYRENTIRVKQTEYLSGNVYNISQDIVNLIVDRKVKKYEKYT